MLQRSRSGSSRAEDSSAPAFVPMGDAVRGRLWFLYVILALATVARYYASGQTVLIFPLLRGRLRGAVLLGVAIHQPKHRLPWVLFALGQVLFVAGDVI